MIPLGFGGGVQCKHPVLEVYFFHLPKMQYNRDASTQVLLEVFNLFVVCLKSTERLREESRSAMCMFWNDDGFFSASQMHDLYYREIFALIC